MKLVGGLRYSTIGAVLIICFSQSGESRSQKVRQFDYYRKAFEWKFQIPTGRNYCFTNEMEEGEVLSFNFGVVQSVVGKNLTISFTLIDESDGSTLINVEGRDSVELDQIEVGKRNLELCFYNDRDRYHYKTVILYMSSSKYAYKTKLKNLELWKGFTFNLILHRFSRPITWDDGMERELDELDMLAYNFKNSFDSKTNY